MNENALCWINGSIKPAVEASISVFDHGLLYGDGDRRFLVLGRDSFSVQAVKTGAETLWLVGGRRAGAGYAPVLLRAR